MTIEVPADNARQGVHVGVGGGVGKPLLAVDGLWRTELFLGRSPPPSAELAVGTCGERKFLAISPNEQSDHYQSEGPREISRAVLTSVFT